MPMTHVCGRCERKYGTATAYAKHKCVVTGFLPIDLEHQGERAILAGKAALERTGSLSAKEEKSINAKRTTARKLEGNE